MKKSLLLTLFISFYFIGFSQILNENFETGLPSDWTAENAWMHGNVNNLSSSSFVIVDHTKFMAVNDDLLGAAGMSTGKLISPQLDFTDIDNNYAISFEGYFLNSDYQGTDETAKLLSSTDGGSTWNEMYNMDAQFEWQVINVSVGDLAGEPEVWFAFEYDDGGGWNYGFAVDDVKLRRLYQRDLEIKELFVPKYVPNVGDVPISYRVINRGVQNIETFDILINQNGQDYTVNQTIPSLGYGDSLNLQILVPFDISTADLYDFSFEATNVNGVDDENPIDNSGFLKLSSVSNPPTKRTVAEEGTGTWCGWCPRGAVNLEYMKSKYHDEFIGIAVHNNDIMALPEYDGPLPITGFPGLLIDRNGPQTDPGDVEANFFENQKNITPIGVSFERVFDVSNRLLSIDYEISIHTRLEGDYRYALIITEDYVTGPSPQYDQANYYSNSINLVDIHGVNWFDLPNPVPGPDLFYHEVARTIIGGYEGEAGSIGSSLQDADVLSGSIYYTVPGEYNEDNVNAVLAVIDAESGQILNGYMKPIVKTTGIYEPPSEISNVEIFPNPSIDEVNVSFNVEQASDVRIQVFNTQSILIKENLHKKLSGNQSFKIEKADLPSGIYYVKIIVNDRFLMEKIIFTE